MSFQRVFNPRLIVLLAIIAAAFIGKGNAATSAWVEVTGHAAIAGEADRDSARRRALADALFNAALAGGADVRGHTAISSAVVTSDLTIVRAMGRVLEHKIVAQTETGGLWAVSIRARVGLGGDPFCASPHRLVVSAYAPRIEVAPQAPAWTAALAQSIATELTEQLARHPATEIFRITDQQIPKGQLGSEAMDYSALTKGSIRLQPGELGFTVHLRLAPMRDARGPGVALDADMQLHSANGEVSRQTFQREATLSKPAILGRLAELTQRDRITMTKALTKGLKDSFTRLLDAKACDPITARLAAAEKGSLSVPIGRRHGLSRATIAFTADRDSTTTLLEIVELSADRAILRPLDPGLSTAALAGRPVRFVEAAW